MKLYYHPISTTSRPVMLFAAESRIPLEMKVVDLFTGEHVKPPYSALNPNKLIPTLEDGDFVLTENSAILKYLADKIDSPAYPERPEEARAGQRAHGLDQHPAVQRPGLRAGLPADLRLAQAPQRRGAVGHAGARPRARRRWLKVLDEHVLGPSNPYLCGDALTIADYHAASYVALAEVIGSDLAAYPNVKRWLGRMKSLKSWSQAYEVIEGFAAVAKGKQLPSV